MSMADEVGILMAAGFMGITAGNLNRQLHNEMPRTCASCKHKKERVLRGHRITTSAFCELRRIDCPENENYACYAPRFEKLSVNQVVKMEDHLL